MNERADLQSTNLGKIFDVLDTTGDGFLSAEDFTGLAMKLATRVVPQDGDPRRQRIVAAGLDWWEQIKRDAGTDSDGRVPRDKFVAATERGLASNPAYLDDAYFPLVDATFQIIDQNGDGRIDRDEYVLIFGMLDLEDNIVPSAFDRIDQNGDGTIDLPEFRSALRDLFTTSDPNAPGAALLG